MAKQIIPTKGNLLQVKKSLSLAKLGYDLMDRKRNILVREMMGMMGEAKQIQSQINEAFADAYRALQEANITMGVIDRPVDDLPVDCSVALDYHSVMGVEIPTVRAGNDVPFPDFSLSFSDSSFDKAYLSFHKAKQLTARLAEIEIGVYRLANAVKKVQKRSNALGNIVIPGLENDERFITDALEEKEREEFSRLKVIKSSVEKRKYAE